MKINYHFEGGRELDAALEQFSAPMAKAVSRRALKKAANPILSIYKSLTKVRTGTLVSLEIVGTRLTRRQARLARRDGKSGVEIYIGTADPAGVQEEFGNARQAAHPALRPAWDAEGGDKALRRIAAELWTDIEKTAARLNGKAKARAARLK